MKRMLIELASLLSRQREPKGKKPLEPKLRWLELLKRTELPAMLPNKLG